jgi:hypothetical protein
VVTENGFGGRDMEKAAPSLEPALTFGVTRGPPGQASETENLRG